MPNGQYNAQFPIPTISSLEKYLFMIDFSWLILVTGGLISGVIAGLLGIGGGISQFLF